MLDKTHVGGLSVLKPEFSFDMKNVVKMKTFFTEYLKNPGQGILLDMSQVKVIDSVGFRSLHNLLAGFRRNNVPLMIYSDDREIADQIRRIIPDIRVVGSEAEALNETVKSAGEDASSSAQLECPICSNRDMPNRIINWDRINYVFQDSSFLPQAVEPGSDKNMDLYRHGVIACNDCMFASFYHTDFVVVTGEHRVPPPFSLDIKNLLIKTTNRRRDVLQKSGYDPSQFKDIIQNKKSLECLYRLCADCIASVSFDRSINRFYESGLANLLIYYYMAEAKKDKALLEKAETAFKDCLKYRPDERKERVWQSYYFRIVLTMLSAKQGASLAIMESFRKERDALPAVEQPAFDLWFRHAQRVHKQEIHDVVVKYL